MNRTVLFALTAGGVFLGLLLINRISQPGAVQEAGAAVGSAVVDAGAGVVLGVGDAMGIPRTNVSQGQAELDAGDYWNASFHLPAGEFISGAWKRLTN